MPNPTCPHCNYEFDDDETWHSSHRNEVHAGDSEISDLTCHACGNKFHVVCVHDINWVPCDADGDLL